MAWHPARRSFDHRVGRGPGRLAAGIALALLVTGCASGDAPASADDRLEVVVTLNILGDFAAQVGGEHVRVHALVPLGGDPHLYEPTPGDAVEVARADVVLTNGLGLEPWAEQLLEPVAHEPLVTGERVLAEERLLVDAEGTVDPHLWMDPSLAVRYVEVIADGFAVADPDNADDYERRAVAYREELTELDAELASAFEAIPPAGRRLVTSHDAYSYFADRYGLEVTGTVLGVSTENEPSAQHLRRLIEDIRALEVPVVFVETTVNPAVIERVARDAGVDIGEPLYGDSLGEQGSGAETYVEMMRHNADAIVAGLTQDG